MVSLSLKIVSSLRRFLFGQTSSRWQSFVLRFFGIRLCLIFSRLGTSRCTVYSFLAVTLWHKHFYPDDLNVLIFAIPDIDTRAWNVATQLE